MSSNYQQKKRTNALGAIDTKGNIVLEQFQDGTALLFQPGNAQPFCVATDYDRTTASWSSRVSNMERGRPSFQSLLNARAPTPGILICACGANAVHCPHRAYAYGP